MKILAIESSCDETAVSICETQEFAVISELISSQVKLHAEYGGVVPELASREHLKNLPWITKQALKDANLTMRDIDLISVTGGPGLLGCLLMGYNFAKGLSIVNKIPLQVINHIEGHLLSPCINQEVTFPALGLVVSGGHTEIHLINAPGDYKLLSRTIDDAAGEAFDKSANLLGFEYPGGKELAELADTVNKSEFKLPKIMPGKTEFSFSGLKTAISLLIKKHPEKRSELAFTIQEAIVNHITEKLLLAVDSTGINTILVSGGVSANKHLRKRLPELNLKPYFPEFRHCVDNATMIAYAGSTRLKTKSYDLPVNPRWRVEDL